MPFTEETIAKKSYNQCIKCKHLGVKCDGPNVISMDIQRFCEWCRLRKEDLRWSVEKLSEVSGVGKATVAKIMTGNVPGLNGETISAITCALIYGYCPNGEGWGKYPCAMMAVEQEEDQPCPECARHIEQHNEDLEKIAFLKKQIEFKESQMVAKDTLIAERADFLRLKDKDIRSNHITLVILAAALAVSVVINVLQVVL